MGTQLCERVLPNIQKIFHHQRIVMLNGHFESLIPKEVKAENVDQINLAYRGIQYYPFTPAFDIKIFVISGLDCICPFLVHFWTPPNVSV
jgi:hypothetical protein